MNEFYLQRHFKLWEDNNTLLNRIVFLTAVISLSLVIKVLIPFVDFSSDKQPLIQVIDSLSKEKEVTNAKIEKINNTAKVLAEVNKYIAKQPWQSEKKKLISRYRTMRISPPAEGYSKKQYQQEADDTITTITELLQQNVLNPLLMSVVGEKQENHDPDQLSREIQALDQFMFDWKQENVSKDWYRTIQGKDRTMNKLTEDLNHQLNVFSRVVKAELTAVNRAKLSVDNELTDLNSKITSEADKLKILDDELQKVLPEWLRGLVRIEHVIQLLPAILVGVAVFVIAVGVKLTRHYKIYSTGKNFPEEIMLDPGMSSTWTLIHRGFIGSIQTIVAYTLFILFTWFLFEKSMALLLLWLSIDPTSAWVSNVEFWSLFVWSSRVVFVLLMTFIFTRLRRS